MTRLITREEVQKHNTERNVWMVIHNHVYDITKFLNEHPGGADSLMDFAGQDATQAFEDVGHSDDAREMMKKYKIGKLPPGEHTKEPIASCCKPRKKSSGNAFPIGTKDCVVCQQTSRRPRGPPCGSSKLKWAILALGAAVIIGVAMKKYMT